MNQVVFVVELVSNGEKTSYAVRLTNGQLVACAFDKEDFSEKFDKLLLEFEESSAVSSSAGASDKE